MNKHFYSMDEISYSALFCGLILLTTNLVILGFYGFRPVDSVAFALLTTLGGALIFLVSLFFGIQLSKTLKRKKNG